MRRMGRMHHYLEDIKLEPTMQKFCTKLLNMLLVSSRHDRPSFAPVRVQHKGRSPEHWISHKHEASIAPSLRGILVTVVGASVASLLTFDAINRAEDNNNEHFDESSLQPSMPHHTPLPINQKIKVDDFPALKLQPCPLFPHKGPLFDRQSYVLVSI